MKYSFYYSQLEVDMKDSDDIKHRLALRKLWDGLIKKVKGSKLWKGVDISEDAMLPLSLRMK